MNERIKELRASAFAYATVNSTDYFENKQEFNEKFDEKFAELIVKEAIQQIRTVGYKASNNIADDVREMFENSLKQHFGVEE